MDYLIKALPMIDDRGITQRHGRNKASLAFAYKEPMTALSGSLHISKGGVKIGNDFGCERAHPLIERSNSTSVTQRTKFCRAARDTAPCVRHRVFQDGGTEFS